MALVSNGDAPEETKEQEEHGEQEYLESKEDLEIDGVILPKSLVAPEKDHSKREQCIAAIFSHFYDILTILISIADVTTDIMVLLSFYNPQKMTFFYISLVILIIAQIGYLIVFFLSFDVEDFLESLFNKVCGCECCCCKHCMNCLEKVLLSKFCSCKCTRLDSLCNRLCNWCGTCCKTSDDSVAWRVCDKVMEGIMILLALLFVIAAASTVFAILLPFGHLVSFLLFFTENNDSRFTKWFGNKVGIQKRTNIPLEEHWSEMATFTAKKINKHGGFILEAFLEALPQSILQLIAMVYFKETDLMSVCSILLSFTSIMTKSLVISQGLEWKSFLFTWLSVCADFFSIFFMVSWIFLSNEYLNGDFLGHFSIIGEIWCWKVTVALLLPLLFIAACYICVAMWAITWTIIKSNLSEPAWFQILMVLIFLTIGNAVAVFMYTAAAVIMFFLLEIACFSIVSGFIYIVCTMERWEYTEKKSAATIKRFLHFIGDASYKNNDVIIRILCLNYAYKKSGKLGKYIEESKRAETLHKVSYKNIRNHCDNPKSANLISSGLKMYCGAFHQFKVECIDGFDHSNKFEGVCLILWWIAGMLWIYISFPVYLLSRVVTLLFPYFIIGYLQYYGLWFKMHIFELSMLAFYVFLQLILFILGLFVFRTHRWLWHVAPSEFPVRLGEDLIPFFKRCYMMYDSIQWLPVTREIVLRKFGKDIGPIIIDYVKT
eukprot:39776_1